MTLNRRHILFGILMLLSIAAIWGPMQQFVSDPENDTSSYIVLIPFISLTLIYFDKERIFRSLGSSVGLASVGFAICGLLYYLGRVYSPQFGEQDRIGMMAATTIMFWFAGFLLIYGFAAFKAGLFSLLFLVFAIPIPSQILDVIVVFLQKASANLAGIMFSMTQTPVYRESDFVFTLPGLTIEVAKECSSIRSSIGTLIVVLLVAHLYLRSMWTKAVLVLAVVPISVFKNAVRIVTLTLLAVHVDMGFITGRLHTRGGVVFMILGLVVMYPLLVFLLKSEKRSLDNGVSS